MLTALFSGLGLGLSLIVAIGAQNAFVLRQGIRREHVGAVALVCIASDVVLITTAVAGAGAILAAAPWLLVAVRWVGAAFLVGYGLLAVRRAWKPTGEALAIGEEDHAVMATTASSGAPTATLVRTRSLTSVVATCLALTWLNPHLYLDVLLLGTVASTHGDQRWWFATGAVCASITWFLTLAFGARLAGRWLRSPRAWRVFDACIAVSMIALGLRLAASA
ncbi:LysE/ArgO family amino acid transporter [Brooklawnia cerclae]|uniref:L-lysine exporter family protein LysE/ArgO n=1 Tax=Brooklawnia cerclae TaxID=349934 RepID=A0ABX0SBI0_9ACTN|nr:LysE/ArgO family amino acid transporter [Brooklawnia cerclae]NIH55742.1 L-lysine exporter family protein LysE/ArgO [Brooklawnia cerclae]